MKKSHIFGAVLVALLLGAVVSTASAGADYFLKVDGVDGESTDAAHKQWIDVASFTHDISSSASTTGGARGTGRPQVGPLVIAKAVDKTSPKLSLFCCAGTNIPTVVLVACQSGGGKHEFMRYALRETRVSSVSVSVDASGNLVEEVSLTFGSIEWQYTEFDRLGKAKGTVQGGWDVRSNKAL